MEIHCIHSNGWRVKTSFMNLCPKSDPSAVSFTEGGITVNFANSYLHGVELLDLQVDSSSEYHCDVTGEAPAFVRHQFSSNMNVIECNEPSFHVIVLYTRLLSISKRCLISIRSVFRHLFCTILPIIMSWYSARDYCQDQKGSWLVLGVSSDICSVQFSLLSLLSLPQKWPQN